jgi:hypothetical protein
MPPPQTTAWPFRTFSREEELKATPRMARTPVRVDPANLPVED